MFADEFKKIDSLGDDAFSAIQEGKYKKAERVLDKLKQSWAAKESLQVEIPIRALIYLKTNKKEKAKKLCLEALHSIWGNEDLLNIIRLSNTSRSTKPLKQFIFEIHTKKETGGLLGAFERELKVTFGVVGETKEHALDFVAEIVRSEAERIHVFAMTETAQLPEDFDCEGVYWSSPFGLLEEVEQSAIH